MSAHAADPFKRPSVAARLDDDDDISAPDAAAAVSSSSPRSTSAPALSAPPHSPYLTRLFPDRRSRLTFLICFAAALAGSIYWLVYTIRSKWQYGLDHPSQTVTYERFERLPAMFALGITYPEKSVPPAASLFRIVIPRFTRAKGTSYFNRYISCAETQLFYPLAFCTPTDAEGRHLLRAVPGELDGSSALSLDLSGWPLYFEATTDQLCLTAYHLANTSLLGPKLWEVPQIGLVPLSAQLALAATEQGQAGHRSSNDSAVLSFVGLLPTQTFYGYNSNHYLSFKASLTRRVNGQESLDYEYSEGRDVKLAVDSFPAYRNDLLQTLQDFNSSHAANVSTWLSQPESEVSFFVSELCFGPHSFVGTVITEQSPYGVVSFLADLGGFANLVTITLLFLFPFANKAVQPRSFIVLFIAAHIARWKARRNQGAAEGALATQEASSSSVQPSDATGVQLSSNPVHSVDSQQI